jgi:N-acyl-phosphatidylethanolamine-hydrolysing phospholipase D
MRRWTLPALVACTAVTLVHVGFHVPAPADDAPPHHVHGGGFRNLDPAYSYPIFLRARHVLRRSPPRGPMPFVLANDGVELRANGHQPTVTWVGHSTLLIQIDGVNILTDPHFGQRASPLGFAGPRRIVPAGIAFSHLPPIDVVVISHDHYDHLDRDTVRRLAREHRPTFYVPLGIKAWLADNGVGESVELDWWQSRRFKGLTITCTPAQHSSGRGLHDQNSRLWSSWMIAGASRRIYFAGDTGYTPALGEIGRRLGAPDLAVLPIGGYSDYRVNHPNHLNPEEAVQVLEELEARLLVPMHWGTFDFNREPFREPPERLLAEALRRGLEERIAILSPGQTIPW